MRKQNNNQEMNKLKVIFLIMLFEQKLIFFKQTSEGL